LNKKLIFFLKFIKLKSKLEFFKKSNFVDLTPMYLKHINTPTLILYQIKQTNILQKNTTLKKTTQNFLKNLTNLFFTLRTFKTKYKTGFLFFINTFFLKFLESLFKSCLVFNLKKGTNKLVLKQVSFRKFSSKYFKKNLKTTKQILGVLYYSLLLKDSSIFINFFKKIIEQLNIKLHKKLLLGLRKLIKDFFLPLFSFLGVSGVFLNVKGKIGVSGSAKKRRYYFYFGRHSITTQSLKMDCKFVHV
jgi:hypothetical protein